MPLQKTFNFLVFAPRNDKKNVRMIHAGMGAAVVNELDFAMNRDAPGRRGRGRGETGQNRTDRTGRSGPVPHSGGSCLI